MVNDSTGRWAGPKGDAGREACRCPQEVPLGRRDFASSEARTTTWARRHRIARSHTIAVVMAPNGSAAGPSKALEAVSLCPRQQMHRPVKQLSYEVANHVNAYLDNQRCMLPLPRLG